MKQQTKFIVAILIGVMAGGVPSLAAVLDITFRPAAGDYISAGDFTNTWDEIELVVNNLDADNISDSCITSAQIAPGGVALSNLSADIAGFATVGAIQMYAGSTQTDTMTTAGWFLCDGRALSRTTYANLFSITGVSYGPGNGATTFNVPDFRARVAVGACTVVIPQTTAALQDTRSIYAIGDTGGQERHMITEAELASHTHSIYADGGGPGSFLTVESNQQYVTILTDGMLSTGSNVPHETRQPYLAINYIIYAGKL